jgi:hypothetical protein
MKNFSQLLQRQPVGRVYAMLRELENPFSPSRELLNTSGRNRKSSPVISQSPMLACSIIALLFALVVAGCASTRTGDNVGTARPAADCPERFVPAGQVTAMAGAVSHSPMKDPRDGTEIVLARSTPEWADYQVPVGRYGVGQGEFLRLDPATGHVIGIVRK